MAVASPPASRWLHGPRSDLLLGCGLLHALLFLAFAVAGPEIRAHQPVWLLPLLLILLTLPHYGGTLVRVYETRGDRRAYSFFSLWVTLALLGLFGWGLADALVRSVLLTLYLTWSPWHYTGQNYGIAVMFLRRRGVDLDLTTQRILYGSFLSSYAIVFMVFHAAMGEALAYNRVGEAGVQSFLSLGLPTGLIQPLVALASLVHIACLVAAAWRLSRRGSLRDIAPAAAIVVSQALWFSLPFAVRLWGVETGIEPIDRYMQIGDYIFWVGLAHAVQYLWITSYYGRTRGGSGWTGMGRYFAKVGAAGIGVAAIPILLFGSGRPGGMTFDAGLGLLVASIINLHHFILDGAIWKLRSSRVGSVLIRSVRGDDSGDAPAAATGGSWGARIVWSLLGLCTLTSFVGLYDLDVRYRSALLRGDWKTAEASLDRAAWFGRDSDSLRRELAREVAREGDLALAVRLVERALELAPDDHGYRQLGELRERQGETAAAEASYRAGLELHASNARLWLRLGELLLEQGRASEALAAFERVAALRPELLTYNDALERARALTETPP